MSATKSTSTLKVALASNVLIADTIASVGAPTYVLATTVGGVEVEVPAITLPGAQVLLNSDGTAPTTELVEGVNLFNAADAAANLVVISGTA